MENMVAHCSQTMMTIWTTKVGLYAKKGPVQKMACLGSSSGPFSRTWWWGGHSMKSQYSLSQSSPLIHSFPTSIISSLIRRRRLQFSSGNICLTQQQHRSPDGSSPYSPYSSTIHHSFRSNIQKMLSIKNEFLHILMNIFFEKNMAFYVKLKPLKSPYRLLINLSNFK